MLLRTANRQIILIQSPLWYSDRLDFSQRYGQGVSMPGRHKHRPFITLSRRSRRKKVIGLKNLIRRERHRCGGLFYDECDFTAFDKETGYVWRWSDIYFTGSDAAVLWNAEIITTQVAFKDAVEGQAFDEAYALLSEEERPTLFMQIEPEYAALNGLTFSQYVEKREQEISRDKPPVIYAGYQYLPGYAYGLGLRIIVNAPALSQQVIEEAITDFRSRGEVEWQSPEPASF